MDAAESNALAVDGGGWLQFEAPGEHVNERAGVIQVIDVIALRSIADRFAAEAKSPHFAGLLVDRDHFSLDDKQPSEALGWLRELRVRDGVPEARIQWTAIGRPLVEGRVYKFFSTVYDLADVQQLGQRVVDGKTYRVVRPLRLNRLALTNDPNNRGGRPITNRTDSMITNSLSRGFSLNPTLVGFSSGAQQRATRRVAEFLSPSVPVTSLTGNYHEWSSKTRFRPPNTVRALGGGVAQLGLTGEVRQYNCTPHALDIPIDRAFGADVDVLLRDAQDEAFDIAGLVLAIEVVAAAKAAAGAGEDIVDGANFDPVSVINAKIRALILAAACEGVGVLFGAGAWERVSNNTGVKQRCPGGPNFGLHPSLFLADAEFMSSWIFHDTAPEGIDPALSFVLDDEILIFARSAQPNRRDPSFMKTFRLRGIETPTSWERKDGRVVSVKVDLATDVRVTNTAGAVRLNFLAG